jgi:hypothetical protein
VPRLWASRRIAYLADQIRQEGADAPGVPRSGVNAVLTDPRHRELVDEIVRLSTEFGVLSEYTAFLATEGTDLSNWHELVAGCGFNLDERAVRSRSGTKALNQGWNFEDSKQQARLNLKNESWDEDLRRVGVAGVVQVSDRAYFQRGGQWIDSRLIAGKQTIAHDRVVKFGSPEYRVLIDRLIEEHRQSVLAVKGAKLLLIGGERVLVLDPEDC